MRSHSVWETGLMTSLFILTVFQAFCRRERNSELQWVDWTCSACDWLHPSLTFWCCQLSRGGSARWRPTGWNVTGMLPEHFLSAADHLAEPQRRDLLGSPVWGETLQRSEVRGRYVTVCRRQQQAKSGGLKGHYVVLEKKWKLWILVR